MCTANCLEMIHAKMDVVMIHLEKEKDQYLDRVTSCLYHCLQDRYIQQSVIAYKYVAPEEMRFLSGSAFTDAIISFNNNALSGKLNDRGANLKTVFSRFLHYSLLNLLKKNKKKWVNELPLSQVIESKAEIDTTNCSKKPLLNSMTKTGR
jgi:hypothetical protein